MIKSKQLMLFCAVLLEVTSISAYPIVSYNRTRDRCGIGCATVKHQKDMVDITTADGKPGKGWVVDIQCFGAGISHCPHKVAAKPDEDIEKWSVNIYENLSEYAQKQINMGITSGTKICTYIMEDGSSKILKRFLMPLNY
jgi:hypothetical protein